MKVAGQRAGGTDTCRAGGDKGTFVMVEKEPPRR